MSDPEPDPDPEPRGYASPACSLHEVSDAYLGYFTREEIVPRLDEVHAAAHVLAGAPEEPLRIRAARWSATLTIHMTRLNAAPSPSPPSLDAGAARAQMTRVIALLAPKVRDDRLHADLMLIAGELAAAE